jgi:hypothetical protein
VSYHEGEALKMEKEWQGYKSWDAIAKIGAGAAFMPIILSCCLWRTFAIC